MRKFLAMAVAVLTMAASGLAQYAAPTTFVNRLAITQAAITASRTAMGFALLGLRAGSALSTSAAIQTNDSFTADSGFTTLGGSDSGTRVILASPDSSIKVTGSGTSNLTVEVNTTSWNGPNGSLKVPVVVANTSFTGGPGLGSTNTIYTATADGFYRVSVYMNVAAAASCSSLPCAGEQITLQWSDGLSTTSLRTTDCNLVTPCGTSFVAPVWVRAGQSIRAYGQSDGISTTAPTGGTYNAYVLVEQL